MATRKSKIIGKTINDLLVIDSFHIGSQTRFAVKCQKCKRKQEKGWHSIVESKCECDFCGNGRKKRNANGHYGEKLYNKYMQILRRTKNPHIDSYKYYGARGIKMCDEWQENFQAFYDWSIANGYKEGLTIDRIDVNGDYCPSNCRWVDSKTQSNNKRSNIYKTYNGKTQTLAQWADEFNIPRYIVYNRNRAGWSIDKIVNMPIGTTKRKKG